MRPPARPHSHTLTEHHTDLTHTPCRASPQTLTEHRTDLTYVVSLAWASHLDGELTGVPAGIGLGGPTDP